ncbi:methylglyoxal reductase (NADPH-dependent) gre2 [Aphanomyces cochlioides]|nr:methylglyoxal reductase (NADPH-dependent) gre2 [Aphanomyces cochlioides]
MCPTWILGPMLQPELNESSKTIHDYVAGNIQEIPRGDKAIEDVRDVAQAHIAAFENPQASGRYFLVGDSATEVEIAAMIKAALPNAPDATKVADGEDAPPLLYSCVKAEHELGIRFRSAEEMIHATCDSLVKHRFAS